MCLKGVCFETTLSHVSKGFTQLQESVWKNFFVQFWDIQKPKINWRKKIITLKFSTVCEEKRISFRIYWRYTDWAWQFNYTIRGLIICNIKRFSMPRKTTYILNVKSSNHEYNIFYKERRGCVWGFIILKIFENIFYYS